VQLEAISNVSASSGIITRSLLRLINFSNTFESTWPEVTSLESAGSVAVKSEGIASVSFLAACPVADEEVAAVFSPEHEQPEKFKAMITISDK